MDRKSIIKEVGALKPSMFNDTNSVNFSSTFIIPIPHNVHSTVDIKSFFETLDQNWEIQNNTLEEDLSLQDIKKYIKDSMFARIPENDKQKKSFLLDCNNLFLCYKHPLPLLKYGQINLSIAKIDLLVMEGNIAFFTYTIELDNKHLVDLNTISTKINRDLRDFRKLSIDIYSKELYFRSENQGISILEYFMSLTTYEHKSFLNVDYTQNKFNVENDIEVIFESTYYAKMITALHIDNDSVTLNNESYPLAPISNSLTASVTINIGILEELSYLLGTTSSFDFDSELGFVNYENYTYKNIQEQGINIWKYWSGIALLDSVAFFSIKHGGSHIVYAAKTSNYYIYILNLYVNIRLKFYEDYIIDKDFISIERIYPSVKEVQKIKNHYIANEVSRKFQPNYIHNKMAMGLKNENILSEVEENIATTLELTKNNTDIVFSIGAGIATLSSMLLSGDMIIEWYDQHPYVTTIFVIVLIMTVVLAVSKKSYIIRLIKDSFKSIKRSITSI